MLLQDSNKHSAAPAASVDINSPMSERHPTLVDAASDLALSQLDALSHAHHYYNQNHSFIYTQRNAWEMLYDRTIDCSLRSQETPVEEACACSPLVHVTSLMDVVMEKEEERGGEVESEVVVMGKGGDDKRMSGEKDDARRVAETIGIPYYVMNFKDDFRKNVMDYFADSYLNGQTPNPCIACNRYVKWEALLMQTIIPIRFLARIRVQIILPTLMRKWMNI